MIDIAAHDHDANQSQPCWWMLAGVVDYKLCDRDFDCENCPLDASLHRVSEYSVVQHSDELESFEFVNTLFYHPAHVWARVEDGGNVRFGVDDFAQSLLGKAYSVSLPVAGSIIEAGKQCWSVTHKAGETFLPAPLTGEVIEVNTKLFQCPSLLNREPYGTGWAAVIKSADLEAGLGNLFYGAKAMAWYTERSDQLSAHVSSLTSPMNTLPDGGKLKKDFLSELSTKQVLDVLSEFLPASQTRQRFEMGKTICDSKLKRR